MPAEQIYEFGHFRIDPNERLLLRDGKTVSLTPKAFETLLALVEHSGHVVKKDELMKRIWPDAFVEEVNLAQNVSAIRRALDTDGEHYIETIPKLGYRLVIEARLIGMSKEAGAAPTHLRQEIARESIPISTSKRNKRRALAFAFAALLLLAAAASTWWATRHGATAVPRRIRSLAVLPLENLSQDPEQEYFAEGMTDELITSLAKIQSVRVISRNSIMPYKGRHEPVAQIGRELSVDAVIEGTVMRQGNRVRITAQLIEAHSDQH
ncbi:MAG TPA: winged helix-turn-helix domain-containing protein, partial [Terriglobales bacterium]|nr:winged helix-turn-helix domain-containing protein [Terriglobales bacterium]